MDIKKGSEVLIDHEVYKRFERPFGWPMRAEWQTVFESPGVVSVCWLQLVLEAKPCQTKR